MSRINRLRSDVLFNSDELSQNLAKKAARGGVTTMSTTAISIGLGAAGTVVLARLLTPNDYGLIGMVTVVLGFAQMFKDAGLAMATVQKDCISHNQISTLFWINVLISVCLGFCVLAVSPLVSRFYGRPELTAVTAALSTSLIIGGMMIQHQALLNRHMQFGTLAIIQIVSQILTLIVTVILAIQGWHYWALVVGTITSSLASTLLTFYFCPWIPGRMKTGSGVRGMLKYGGHLTGFNFINYFSRNLDNILIGKFIGANGLGVYDKAYQLFMLPITSIRAPLNAVALPVLSSLKEQPERYIKYYQRLVDIMTSITVPLAAYCGVEADFLIRLVLGPQWLGVIPVFRILLIAGFLQAISGTAGLVQLSMGFSERYFKWGVVGAILFVSSFVVGLPFGIKGVATAYVAANVIIFFPTLLYCFHNSPVTVLLVIKTVSVPIAITGVAITGALITQYAMYNSFINEHVVFFVVFVCITLVMYSRRKSVRDTFNSLRKVEQTN